MRFLLALALLVSSVAFAGSKIEDWKNGEGIKFVVRSDDGRFVTYGELTNESWNDGDDVSEWVARRADGTFVTGYKGKLEKFKVKGPKEELRLVIRNAKGMMVTWKAVDSLFSSGFEMMDLNGDGKKETVYVMRYQGRFVNWAKAKLESWSNVKTPVLVVRDSADAGNNGKLLAWIAGEKTSTGKIVFRDPETGRFVSQNR
ncbi:MAG: hypothetical protein K2P81_08670 [Bacteriovoracaceae bacterium]|nr:hypothetical protein [Bacteriovoracaceae bacterium]